MEDVAHSEHGTQIEFAGYRACDNEWCSELILKEIAERTRGFCPTCYRQLCSESFTEIEVRNRGQRMVAPIRMKATPSKDKGNRQTSRRARKANQRAMKRLAMLFPDLYDVLRAEERARDGLEPWPIETVIEENEGPDTDTSVSFARLLAALDDHGIESPE